MIWIEDTSCALSAWQSPLHKASHCLWCYEGCMKLARRVDTEIQTFIRIVMGSRWLGEKSIFKYKSKLLEMNLITQQQ